MKVDQVAAQLYTIREHARTGSDVAIALKRIADIGYKAVQVSGIAPLPDDDLAQMLNDAGLVCCSTHEDPARLLSEPEVMAERLKKLSCGSTACPSPGEARLDTIEDVKSFAKRLNAAGKVFHEAGLIFAYHNHAGEFRRLDGRVILEVLYEETDPRYMQGEPDTYWIQYGGGDPVHWCRWLKGRLPLLHMKDYKIDAQGAPAFAEIGQGNLDWRAIVAAAEESGCEWFIVEQDICDGDPFDSLQMSFEYIRESFCS
jgi:sugar phosphate isomerase/epimerase